jgi:5-methylcytosine-specific restriction endonuclease McrA
MTIIRVASINAKDLYDRLEMCDYIKIAGNRIKMRSHRYKCFKNSGLACVSCGIVGSRFGVEKHTNPTKSQQGWEGTPYHLNLYAINESGNEVLMTKDHIIPKSKGGKNHVDNYQTMCTYCNQEKGDDYESK